MVDGPGPRRAARCWRSPRPRARPRTSSTQLGRPGRPGTRRPTTRAGRRCRTSGSARAATPSAAGSRCCAGSRTPAPTRPTDRSRSSSRRSARCSSRRSRGSATSSRSSWRRATTAPLEDVVRRLADAAYSRVDLVEKRGEFAVRGGIVDVFPPTEEHPLRVEFWGDDVEEIRTFAVADQRTLETVERLWAPPCRELLLTDEVRRRAAELGRGAPAAASSSPTRSPTASPSRAWSRWRRCSSTRWSCSSTCCPPTPTCWCSTPSGSGRRAHDLVATSEEFLGASWAAAAGGGRRRSTSARRRTAPSATSARTRSRAASPGGRVSPFGIDDDDDRALGRARDRSRRRRWSGVPTRALPAQAGRGLPRRRRARGRRRRAAGCADGYRVVVVHPGHGPAQRMVEAARRARRRRRGWSTTLDDAPRRPTWSR